jgi:glycosyltransferase involved in cell wall biosynthesis
MSNLKSQDLLLIAPHFKVFIKDQANLIRPYLNNMTVLIPIPYFSGLVLELPHMKEYFEFLNPALKSQQELAENYTIIFPKYFTLPIEMLRKRNCYFTTRSCIKTLSKKNINFNLIHSHFIDKGFIGVAIKNLSDKPLVVTAHGGDVYDLPFRDNYYRSLARYVLSNADQVIAVSRFIEEKLLSLGVPSSKLNVIPNGYDRQLFRPRPLLQARRQLNLPVDKKILLSVSNLVDVKGHYFLIEAMKSILCKRSEVMLILVGSGPLKKVLEKRLRELGLEGKVLIIGGKKHEEIPIWMNACDLFVLPSLSEGFPTVIPEALACGKPVVGTKVGGVSEILKNKEVGLLVEPQNISSLALGIIEALNEKWHPRVIHEYAEQYSWNNLVPRIISIYEKVL